MFFFKSRLLPSHSLAWLLFDIFVAASFERAKMEWNLVSKPVPTMGIRGGLKGETCVGGSLTPSFEAVDLALNLAG